MSAVPEAVQSELKPGALAGLRVVELGEFIAAPFCGKLLGDLGADVIKIEPPGGDTARRFGPFAGDIPDDETSGLFLNLNTNKRSRVLDLSIPEDLDQLRALLKEADVLIESLRPGALASLGLSWEELQRLNPGLILTSITPFGQTGPYRDFEAYDLTTCAAGGISIGIGSPDREPLTYPLSQGHYVAGLAGAIATLFADAHRRKTGRGQRVDVAEAECWATFLAGVGIQPYVSEGRVKQRTGHRAGQRPHLDAILPCADGYVTIDTPQRRQWQRFLEMLGNPEWALDPRFARPLEMTGEYADEVEAHLAPWLMARTKQQIFEECRANRVPAAPVNSIAEVVAHEQLDFRDYFVRLYHPKAGEQTYPGAPYKLSATPWRLNTPAPLLDPRATPDWLPRETPASRPKSDRPLRVLDFGWVWAGTVCGQVLADMGAEVIKVESRRRLDGMRLGKVFEEGETIERNPQFHNLNRGKLSITVDMSTPEGADLLRELAASCDLVIENFTPGTLSKYGLDYESFRAIKPDIVMLSMTAAGQNGPLEDILAYAPIIHSLSGIDSLIGYNDGRVLGTKHAYLDVLASLFGAVSALSALRHRDLTGEGQHIDLSEWEVATGLLGEAVLEYSMNGRVQAPAGNTHRSLAPHNNYPTSEPGEWVSIAVGTDGEWQSFCRVVGDGALASDPRFATRRGRLDNRDQLDECVASWTRQRTAGEITAQLQAACVAAFPCLNAEGLFLDPHFSERGLYPSVTHPVTGAENLYASPWHLSETPPEIRGPAPLLGQSNEYVLGQILGRSTDEINRLIDAKVIR